jgi:sodium-dependent dicarboxylate transporter 2/3/5
MYNIEISFLQWMSIGLPFSIFLLFISWFYLTKIAFKLNDKEYDSGHTSISDQLQDLGKITVHEKRVLIIFILTALCWISRSFFIQKFIPAIDDTIIAVSAAIILFIIPAGEKQGRLLYWEDLVKIPWGVVLLFGGGMALSVGFAKSGLAHWLGENLGAMNGISIFVIIFILILAVNFLTEITSNLATTSVILPLLAPLAISLNTHPYSLMVSTAMAASCAFMLPVATPPNAIVFGSGYLKISDMLRAGVWLNLISVIILFFLIIYVLPVIWGFDMSAYPVDFAK